VNATFVVVNGGAREFYIRGLNKNSNVLREPSFVIKKELYVSLQFRSPQHTSPSSPSVNN